MIGHLERGGDIGYWGAFSDEPDGLYGTAVCDEGPAFRELEAGFHEGRVSHVSCNIDLVRWKERSTPGPGGLPVIDVIEGRLVEAGPTDDPSDEDAVILTIGGQEPRWIGEVSRSKVLAGLRAVPALGTAVISFDRVLGS